MTINGKDMWDFEAKQFSVEIDHSNIDNQSEWLIGAAMPLFRTPKFGFKPFSITLSVHGDNRDAIKRNCSYIVALCRKSDNVIELDGFRYSVFHGALKKATRKERGIHKYHLLTLDFEGYECGNRVSVSASGQGGFTQVFVNNVGNAISPANIIFTPSRVVSRPVTLKVDGNEIVFRDGIGVYRCEVRENGLVYHAGALAEADIWEAPKLEPGENNINIDIDCELTVEYRPIYV